MIIPSIDISKGRAVQLRRGREFVLDGGDPQERLAEFAVAGEVAIVDLDAARGEGSNAELIKRMCRKARCRVGGGIRDIETARGWLDAGAARIVIGTAAAPEFCAQLPRDRVIAAVDAERSRVVVEGWKRATEKNPVMLIAELAPFVGGFLLTQVEHEGGMQGYDGKLVERAVQAAGDVRVTAAGGISTADEIGALDALGADAQIGMALYTGRLTLGEAITSVLRRALPGDLWPTVVCDEAGVALGLAWSTRDSIKTAVDTRRGVYWSRSRNELWRKGASSGHTQELLRAVVDCDRDALKFVVRQHGSGFCHTGTRGCWPTAFDLGTLERIIAASRAAADPDSGTSTLLNDPDLLGRKLIEEARELAVAEDREGATHEIADVLFFAAVAAARHEVPLADVLAELERRHGRVTRRPMRANGGDS